MNEDKSETTGQRTDDPMLDHACTMRIALAIARRQNELDLRLHRIEQALKLGGGQRHQESMDMAQKQYTAQTRSVLIQQQMLDQQRKATADDNPSMPTE